MSRAWLGWRGMNYEAFVAKLKEAATARADEDIQREIRRAEGTPLRATEGALAEEEQRGGQQEEQMDGESTQEYLHRRFPRDFPPHGGISPSAVAAQNNGRRRFQPVRQETQEETVTIRVLGPRGGAASV